MTACAGTMNKNNTTPPHPGLSRDAFWQRVFHHFAKPEPVQPVELQDENGARIGGVIFIRGEHEFETVRSLFKTRPAEAQLPAAQPSEGQT